MKIDHSIVTCASYGSSGSGVVTDYLSEYSSVRNLGDYEFRFLQDYDGIATLEDALVHTPHRLNSDVAIQNYLRYVDRQCGTFLNRRYERFFNNQWRKISLDFLNKLIDAEWPGYWEQYQIMASSKFSAFVKYQLFPRICKLIQGNRKYIAHYLPRREMYFASPSEEKFLKCVREYIDALCDTIDPASKYKYLFFDQLMPPANISHYERYFNSVKTIVVDRDPRDYYIENVLRWGEGWVPQDVEKFVTIYRKQRDQTARYTDSSNVLRIRFEDVIFHYDDFENKIRDFLKLTPEEHVSPKSMFNPEKSSNNTQLWKNRNVGNGIIKIIEELLPEYLYDFENNIN